MPRKRSLEVCAPPSKRNMALTRDGSLKYPVADKPLKKLLGDGWFDAAETRVRNVGKGIVTYVASDEWPASDSISGEYFGRIAELAFSAISKELEKGWIHANEDVEFACYEQPDGSRIFYLLNIRWWDRMPSTVFFKRGTKRQMIHVPFGRIVVFAPKR